MPDEIWTGEDAPRRVAEEIARIEAEFLADKTRLAETVSFNAETGKFRVDPAPMENAPLIGAMLSRTEDALDDALQGRNGLRDDMRDVRVLRRTHARYANDPQRIELDYTSVAISLRRQFEIKELAETDDNQALLEAVEEGALAIRAHHPEVAENRDRLAQQKLRELPEEDRALLEDALPVLEELSEEVMQEDFRADIPQLLNDATQPSPSGAPPLPGVDETTRIFYRVSRIKLLRDELNKASKKGAQIFDSPEFKTLRLGLTVSALLAEMVRLGLFLFGVI
ncbi:hypothetical protein I6N89_13560 [Pelagibaca abyssi]|nr:hypothetical protein [Salipiger abyssi]